MKNPTKIFILFAVDIHERTEETWQKEFEICKINHENWKDKTVKEFKDFETGWGHTHDIDDFPAGYFLDQETALEYAKSNMADINEAGAYPYIAIVPRCVNCMYPESHTEDIIVLKFNKESRQYDIVTHNDSNIYAIAQYYNPFPLKRKKEGE